jgi:hydroxymethylpyrimidine pyrophosphatase-like HAD family hydrolase
MARDESLPIVAANCLVAFDVDRTILMQPADGNLDGERRDFLFLTDVAHELVGIARRGVNVALLTGNSLWQLANRALKWIVEALVQKDQTALIDHFHFFSTGAGIYLHITSFKEEMIKLLGNSDPNTIASSLFDAWNDKAYLRLTQMNEDDIQTASAILQDTLSSINRSTESVEIQLRGPRTETVADRTTMPVVQITLKPIPTSESRDTIAREAQDRLDSKRFGRFRVRPAGRTSIDVTLHFLDKAFALRWLIDHLRIQGNEHIGQPYGANLLYFGDEVTLGGTAVASGNDFAVSKIDGSLIIAVDPQRPVPLRSNIVVPFVDESGPVVTCHLLRQFNDIVDQQRKLCVKAFERKTPLPANAVEAFKAQFHAGRIRAKIADSAAIRSMPSCVLQTIDALVTLASRDTRTTKQVVKMISRNIDDLLVTIQQDLTPIGGALGTSVDQSTDELKPEVDGQHESDGSGKKVRQGRVSIAGAAGDYPKYERKNDRHVRDIALTLVGGRPFLLTFLKRLERFVKELDHVFNAHTSVEFCSYPQEAMHFTVAPIRQTDWDAERYMKDPDAVNLAQLLQLQDLLCISTSLDKVTNLSEEDLRDMAKPGEKLDLVRRLVASTKPFRIDLSRSTLEINGRGEMLLWGAANGRQLSELRRLLGLSGFAKRDKGSKTHITLGIIKDYPNLIQPKKAYRSRHRQGGPAGAGRVKGARCGRGKRFAAPAGRLANLHAGKRSLPLTRAPGRAVTAMPLGIPFSVLPMLDAQHRLLPKLTHQHRTRSAFCFISPTLVCISAHL